MLNNKVFGLPVLVALLSACGGSDGNQTAGGSPPVIQLNGNAEVTISMGSLYEDEGAIARDEKDGLLPVIVTQTKPVIDALGSYTYTITYVSTDSDNNTTSVKRKITMVDDISPAI